MGVNLCLCFSFFYFFYYYFILGNWWLVWTLGSSQWTTKFVRSRKLCKFQLWGVWLNNVLYALAMLSTFARIWPVALTLSWSNINIFDLCWYRPSQLKFCWAFWFEHIVYIVIVCLWYLSHMLHPVGGDCWLMTTVHVTKVNQYCELFSLTQNLNEDSSHYNSDNGFEDAHDISHITVSILYSSGSQTITSSSTAPLKYLVTIYSTIHLCKICKFPP